MLYKRISNPINEDIKVDKNVERKISDFDTSKDYNKKLLKLDKWKTPSPTVQINEPVLHDRIDAWESVTP